MGPARSRGSEARLGSGSRASVYVCACAWGVTESSDPYCKITTGAPYEPPVFSSVKKNQVDRCEFNETLELYDCQPCLPFGGEQRGRALEAIAAS